MCFFHLIYEPTLEVIFARILVKKQSEVCDLSTACILLRYSFLCFSMGEVYASLIKSVSRSGGFYSVAEMEGGEQGGRGREGRRGESQTWPSSVMLALAVRQAVPYRWDAASSTVTRVFTGLSSGCLRRGCCCFYFLNNSLSLAMQYSFRFFFLLHLFISIKFNCCFPDETLHEW